MSDLFTISLRVFPKGVGKDAKVYTIGQSHCTWEALGDAQP